MLGRVVADVVLGERDRAGRVAEEWHEVVELHVTRFRP